VSFTSTICAFGILATLAIAAPEEPAITLENSLTLRDPFRQPQMKLANEVNEGGRVPELERFQIEQFKLMGIITGPKKNRAMVSSPEGKIFIVSEEMRIGSRRGTVKQIRPNAVIVEEKVVNILGQEERLETSIQFKDKSKM
jgi:Tfp pilus assembly protein PilP